MLIYPRALFVSHAIDNYIENEAPTGNNSDMSITACDGNRRSINALYFLEFRDDSKLVSIYCALGVKFNTI